MDEFSRIVNAYRRERNAYLRAYYAVRDKDEPLGPKGQAAMRRIENEYAAMLRAAYPNEENWLTIASLAVAVCQTFEREDN